MKEVPIIGQILLQLALIALNAVFACAEIAVISINENKIAKMAEKGNKRAVKLKKITSQPARFLSTIQVAITLSGFLGSAFAADNFSSRIVDALLSAGMQMSATTLNTISVILITLVLSYVTLIFGELVPKRIAMQKSEQLALGISSFITFMSSLFSPIVFLLTASTNAILRLIGIDPNADKEEITEEEIRLMVDAGSEKGTIDHSEKQWIQNVFEFDDTTALEIATHRTDMVVLWKEETLEEWEKTIYESRHSIFPICSESVDDIVGVLNTKEYFRLQDKSYENIMREAVTPAYFVPESIKADVLFSQMKASRMYFAVVLDEYGGVYGIVTASDLLEELVGDLDDDLKNPIIPDIEEIAERKWRIQGATPLDDVADLINTELPIDDFESFGGFVLGTFGAIPEDGADIEVQFKNLLITEADIKERRVESAIVTINEIAENPENGDIKSKKADKNGKQKTE